MAEYKFTVANFSLTTSWKRMVQTSVGIVGYDIVAGTATKNFAISGITLSEGESIKYIVLTANLSGSGTIDGSSSIQVNGTGFGGLRKFSADNVKNGTAWEAKFSVRASGNAGQAGALNQAVSYSYTVTFSDVTLTVVTGIGNAFDGKISSLNEGDKIIIPESASNAKYTLVHHEYNTGKALIFRDDSIGTGKWRSSVPSYASSNSYIDSTLDKYLINTWYPTLPSTTTQFLQMMNYKVRTSAHSTSTATTIDRMACTLSASESGLGGDDLYGAPWSYTNTLSYSGSYHYWTREPVGGMANYARCIKVGGTLSNSTVKTTLGMRPTLGVLEEQLVRYDESEGGYLFCSKCTAPTTLYINGSAANVTNLNRETNLTLSWSAGTAGYNTEITGYAVWYSTSANGTYELYGTTTGTSMAIVGPAKNRQVYYFKVQTLGPEDADYCNSDLSSTYRSAATKNGNVSYYDGTRWLLANVKYYNGSAWVEVQDVQYYNGSKWI